MAMRIHYICRGNAFRSRLAEAYTNSCGLPDITVVSSGTVAARHADVNGDMPAYTRATLEKYGVLQYAKPRWDQLTPERLQADDLVIFFTQKAYEEAAALHIQPAHYQIWDIADTGEMSRGVLTPTADDPSVYAFADQTYEAIVSQVNEVLHEQR